jgi:hypothetical protein
MAHTVQIEVPEEIYDSLLKESKQTGQPPEEVIVEWLSKAAHDIDSDPVERFIGAFDSGVPDLAEHHDKYIGEAIAKKLHANGTESQS